MSKKRVAHTVDIIKRLFEQAEMGEPDAMELVGLWDELARLERKWRMQWAEGSERRQPRHMDQLNNHFDRLQRLIERSLRAAEEPALRQTLQQIAGRSRTW
jgi:hypothetical protein